MSLYIDYLIEIEMCKIIGLYFKFIDDGVLVEELIVQIEMFDSEYCEDFLKFFIYNILFGMISVVGVKVKFLKKIVLGEIIVFEIIFDFVLELLLYMKGGFLVEVFLDIVFGEGDIVVKVGDVLKMQVFLYDVDMFCLCDVYKVGNVIVKGILESYVKVEFFIKFFDIDKEIKVVIYIVVEGDILIDLLLLGNQVYLCLDCELYGQCMIMLEVQQEIVVLQVQYFDKCVMMIVEKGMMGVGLLWMLGVNNVVLWIGKKVSFYVFFVNVVLVVVGMNGILLIFVIMVDVIGGIGINLKNWVKKIDVDGKLILNNDGNLILEQIYLVEIGIVLKIDIDSKKLCDEFGKEFVDVVSVFML